MIGACGCDRGDQHDAPTPIRTFPGTGLILAFLLFLQCAMRGLRFSSASRYSIASIRVSCEATTSARPELRPLLAVLIHEGSHP